MKEKLLRSDDHLILKTILSFTFFMAFLFQGNSQVLLSENFEYEAGNLVGQGNWKQQASTTTNPIQLVEGPLTYPGYQDNSIGKAVEIKDAGQDIYKEFDEQTTGTVYYAALVNLTDAQSNTIGDYFMHFGEGGGATTGFSARLFAKKSANGKLQFAATRTNVATSAEFATNEYEFNKTHLIVVKYTLKGNGSTAKDDEVALFVNPVISENEPEPLTIGTNTSSYNPNKIKGIYIRQGVSKKTALGTIDAIRVSKSWEGLFGFITEEPPTLTLNPKSITFGMVFNGISYTKEVNVKGKNLKGDITVTGLTTGEVSVNTTTIPKKEAESENGFTLIATLHPTSDEIFKDIITFESEGMDPVNANIAWAATMLEETADIKTLREKDPGAWATYRMNGEATISYIYKDGGKTTYYLQDNERGITVYDAWGDIKESYQIGDKVKGVIGTLELSFGSLSLVPSHFTLGEVISSGNEITPVTVTLAELTSSGSVYESRLIKVENVAFKDVSEDAIFENGMTSPAINDETADAKMRVFKDADYIGELIPDKAALIGVSTAGNGTLVGPRSIADMILEPNMEMTPESLEKKTTDINIPVELGKFIITTQGLPSPLTLDVRGTNRDFFTSSVTTISGEGLKKTEVTITYQPTAAGMHKATLVIDCEKAPQLSKTINLAANALDPENPPAFSVNVEGLTDFSTEIDNEEKQTIKVTTANLLDYLYVKVMGEGEGSFTISNTMFLKNQIDAPLIITFNPKKEGTFTERIEFSSEGTETFYLIVTGTATGKQEPQPEGDKFPLDTSNPRALLDEQFNDVSHNKVLSINGWKTIAEQGLRAWWGYEFKDDNDNIIEKSAKVTGYSSIPEENPLHEMWLITPPLDFKNSASKMFTFRVMGDILVEGQDAELSLYYMDMADGELYKSPIEIDMPKIPDQNKEWIEYHINLEGQELADVFFMGFHFKATGGNVNSAVYYIDDISYGRADLPIINIPAPEIKFKSEINKEVITDPVNITASNLTESIQLKLSGTNSDKFQIIPETISAEGGSFQIKFSSDILGNNEAILKLSSRGAADQYILISVDNKEQGSNIEISNIDAIVGDITIYDISGKKIKDVYNTTIEEVKKELKSGVYIVNIVITKDSKTEILSIKIIK